MLFPEEREGMVIDPIHFRPEQLNPLETAKGFVVCFSFNFLSLGKGKFCFNNPKLTIDHFNQIFLRMKRMSGITFENMAQIPDFHFYEVPSSQDSKAVKASYGKLRELLKYPNTTSLDKLPSLFQVAVDTSPQGSPRIVGFLDADNIFQIIWLDFEHKLYPMVRPR